MSGFRDASMAVDEVRGYSPMTGLSSLDNV
jgi:hypothetical protein